MAHFIPTIPECSPRTGWLNAGEVRVAAALSTLDHGWTVYVQPRDGIHLSDAGYERWETLIQPLLDPSI